MKTRESFCAAAPADEFAARCRRYLRLCANLPAEGQEPIYHQFARILCGEAGDDEAILRGLEHMRVRLDCGDFRINTLLRLFYLCPETPLLAPRTRAEIRDLLLDFDYWYGENVKFPGRQIIWTENHVMLFMTAEYLAARLYPDAMFRFRGKTGAETAPMLKPKLLRWINLKLRVGFCEWNSNCYTEENMLSLLNLYDFAGDDELREKARDLLDVMTLSLALNVFDGCSASSYGRTYTRMLVNRRGANTTLLHKLLWGRAEADPGDELLGLGSLALASSTYRPRPLIAAIARDDSLVLDIREQQSFDAEDAPALGGGYDTYEQMTLFWHNMAYTHVAVVEKMFEMCERFGIMVNPAVYPEYRYLLACREKGETPAPCRVSTYMSRVNIQSRRTPDYFLSCAQDFRKGELGFQQHIWQASLAQDAVVFTSHPGTLGVEDGRPDFWAGNHFHPRVLMHRDTVFCLYNITAPCPLPYSHAFFPRDRFDEIYEVRNWVFARKQDGYLALYSEHPCHWTREGRWAGSELVCPHPQNVWLCQMGRRAEDGGFMAFISKMLSCEPQIEGGRVTYHSPRGETLRCGWDEPLTADGAPVKTRDYPRFDTPLCQSEYGSGRYRIEYKGAAMTIGGE